MSNKAGFGWYVRADPLRREICGAIASAAFKPPILRRGIKFLHQAGDFPGRQLLSDRRLSPPRMVEPDPRPQELGFRV